jgi:hypothetical protein
MRMTLLASIVGLLAGCEGPRDARVGPVEEVTSIESSTPAYVAVFGRAPIPDYVGRQPAVATDQQLADVAQAHCQRFGRNASLSSTRRGYGWIRMTFFCT